MREKMSGRLVYNSIVVAFFLWVVWHSNGFHGQARIGPFAVGLFALLLSLINLLVDLRRERREAASIAAGNAPAARRSVIDVVGPEGAYDYVAAFRYIAWMFAYVAALWLTGIVAVALFLVSFLVLEGSTRWWAALLGAAGAIGFILLMGELLGMRMPSGVLFT